MAKEDFIFFWGGIYSQWYPSDFEIDGIEYNTAEQYMMAKKALLFKDFETHGRIMQEKNPAAQKALGRTVKGFDAEIWNKNCKKYVFDANFAKFSQNPILYDEIMGTGSKEFVEASPEDKIWGIGLHERDSLAWDKETWQGTNWLGEAITAVRTALIKELE